MVSRVGTHITISLIILAALTAIAVGSYRLATGIIAHRVIGRADELPIPLEIQRVRVRGGLVRPWRITLSESAIGPGASGDDEFAGMESAGVEFALIENAEVVRTEIVFRGGAARSVLRRGTGSIVASIAAIEISDVAVQMRGAGRRADATIRQISILPPQEEAGAWLVAVRRPDLTIRPVADVASSAGDAPADKLLSPLERSPTDFIAPILESLVARVDSLPTLRLSAEDGRVRSRAGEFSFVATLETDRDTPLSGTMAISTARVAGGALSSAGLDVTLSAVVHSAERLVAEADVRWSDVVLAAERIAEGPIELADGRYEFAAELDLGADFPAARFARRIPGTDVPAPLGAGAPEDAALAGALTVTRGHLTMGGVRADVRPALHGLNAPQAGFPVPAPARVDLELSLPATPLTEIAAIVPTAIAGPLAEVRLDGELRWDIRLEAPLRQFSWTRWEETNELTGFTIREIPAEWDVRRLSESFLYEIVDEESDFRRVVVVPAVPNAERPAPLGSVPPHATPDSTYRYVPLSRITPTLAGAVITVEDGEFYRHQGINWLAILTAVELFLREGEIVIGGSTIPMQLAKNVFLDGRRIVARKVQEIALVTLANLSGVVTRDRVLELYLNVIEFAPGVWGIADATEFYFGIPPSELSVAQSVWLATIISNPKRYWVHRDRSGLSEAWLGRMEDVMEIMVERGRLSEEELNAARYRVPAFRSE